MNLEEILSAVSFQGQRHWIPDNAFGISGMTISDFFALYWSGIQNAYLTGISVYRTVQRRVVYRTNATDSFRKYMPKQSVMSWYRDCIGKTHKLTVAQL
jgi:hypothetical protein